MIYRVPQPPLLAFAAHKAPHLIHLGLLHLPKDDVNLLRIKRVEQPCVHLLDDRLFFLSTLITVAELTLRTRTISRTPLPLSVMSTICCFTAGRRPLSWYCKRENGPRTVTIVTVIALGSIGLFPVLHHIGTVTIGTVDLHKSHSTSPTRG